MIDPYRDACRIATGIGGALELGSPFLAAGLRRRGRRGPRAVARGVRPRGSPRSAAVRSATDVPWLQLARGRRGRPTRARPPLIAAYRDARRPRARADDQLLGVAAAARELREAIPFALEHGSTCSCSRASPARSRRAGPSSPARPTSPSARRDPDPARAEPGGGRRSPLVRRRPLGHGRRQADRRSARTPSSSGVSLALALGGRIEGGALAFYGDVEPAERDEQAELFLNALPAEASIMPRCTGKTDIHNLEPEDLRAISVVTAQATGIPLAGFNPKLSG